MLQIALKNKKEKCSHFVKKEAREFVRKIDFDIEIEFNDRMKNTENAQKFKRNTKEKRKKAIDTAWMSKPLHD